MPMTRTVISIDLELYRRARSRAEELGMSFAEYVRTILAEKLGEPPRTVDPSIIFDLGRSTPTDVGRDKDAMIGEAVAALHRRKSAARRR
jgi:hypothetical protein